MGKKNKDKDKKSKKDKKNKSHKKGKGHKRDKHDKKDKGGKDKDSNSQWGRNIGTVFTAAAAGAVGYLTTGSPIAAFTAAAMGAGLQRVVTAALDEEWDDDYGGKGKGKYDGHFVMQHARASSIGAF
jgi:hypothetical protein